MKRVKCITFPKIEQFRNVVSSVLRQAHFVGLDDHGDAIYDPTKVKPTLTFKGSVKLHGTNAGVSYNDNLGLWAQSRRGAFKLSQHDSHFGFTKFVDDRKEIFEGFINEIAQRNNVDTSKFYLTIFGEWVGKGIQKKVAISELEKSLFIFGVKLSNPNDPDFKSVWLDHSGLRSNENRIYNILDFETFEIDIDFNSPGDVQERLTEITQKIEDECPVAKFFGHSGVGEGVVWTGYFNGIRHSFKIKGDEHAVSKNTSKTLAPVDVEKLATIEEFVNYSLTRNRFEQGLQEVFSDPSEYTVKRTGEILKWIVNDIFSEEMDVLEENGLTTKEVSKSISKRARDMFFNEIEVFQNSPH